MNPRVEYEMSEDDLAKLLDACKPTPCIMVGGVTGPTPQDMANHAWSALGEQMGFDPMTVRPIEGKGLRFFTGVPSETDEQRKERLADEAEQKRVAEVEELRADIQKKQERLAELEPRGTDGAQADV